MKREESWPIFFFRSCGADGFRYVSAQLSSLCPTCLPLVLYLHSILTPSPASQSHPSFFLITFLWVSHLPLVSPALVFQLPSLSWTLLTVMSFIFRFSAKQCELTSAFSVTAGISLGDVSMICNNPVILRGKVMITATNVNVLYFSQVRFIIACLDLCWRRVASSGFSS